MKELDDKKFDKLLKKYGAKTMETFEINEVFKYTKKQLKIIKKELDQ